MDNQMIYKSLYEQAIQKIYMVRSPQPDRLEAHDLQWEEVKKQELFDFGDKYFYKYSKLISTARAISTECFFHIVVNLYKAYDIPFEVVNNEKHSNASSQILFTIIDRKLNTLFEFKNVEECNFWKYNGTTPDSPLLKKHKVSSIKTIYLMYERADKQLVRKTNAANLESKYDIYSLKWFFENCFNIDEYNVFKKYTDAYRKYINETIGFILLKSLSPNAYINFKKILENSLLNFDYSTIISTEIFNKYTLNRIDFNLINDIFYDNTYLVLLGKGDFAESLITAEWLYRSLKKASAIDLTSIGMGYFKAIEQLLFSLICLHKNKKKLIHRDNSKTELPVQIELNEENIQKKNIDTSIGSMAIFCKKNKPDIFRKSLSGKAKTYVIESIFQYKDLRNGHLHKDNINNWEVIEIIRNASFRLLFLLLGGFSITDSDKTILGQDDFSFYSEYYKLCEFVNYYSNNIFFLKKDEKEYLFFSVSDPLAYRIENGHIKYSGLYFRDFGKNTKPFIVKESELPDEIYLGKMDFGDGESIKLNPVKIQKIFEKGKFVGSRIFDEDDIDY